MTRSWLLPNGGTPDRVTWPQTAVDPTTCVPEHPGTIQTDVYTGTQAQIDALTAPDSPAGAALAAGEDSTIVVSWSFSTQTVCAPPVVTPPVVTPPVVTPPVVTPPVFVTPPVAPPVAPPVVVPPKPVTPVVTVAAVRPAPVVDRVVAAPVVTSSDLAYTGSEHTGTLAVLAGGIAALGALMVGGSRILRRRS